jgi:hypothetical protein
METQVAIAVVAVVPKQLASAPGLTLRSSAPVLQSSTEAPALRCRTIPPHPRVVATVLGEAVWAR